VGFLLVSFHSILANIFPLRVPLGRAAGGAAFNYELAAPRS
jgi:hypothetical protein